MIVAVILLLLYLAGLWFAKDRPMHDICEVEQETNQWSIGKGVALLAISTGLIALESELLVGVSRV